MIDRSQWESTNYFGYEVSMHDGCLLAMELHKSVNSGTSLTLLFYYYVRPGDAIDELAFLIKWELHSFRGALNCDALLKDIYGINILKTESGIALEMIDCDSGITYTLNGSHLTEESFEVIGKVYG